MAHGNDPSFPHEVAADNTLDSTVVYEGCIAALACQPIQFLGGPGVEQNVVLGGSGVEQGEPLLGGDRELERLEEVADGNQRVAHPSPPRRCPGRRDGLEGADPNRCC